FRRVLFRSRGTRRRPDAPRPVRAGRRVLRVGRFARAERTGQGQDPQQAGRALLQTRRYGGRDQGLRASPPPAGALRPWSRLEGRAVVGLGGLRPDSPHGVPPLAAAPRRSSTKRARTAGNAAAEQPGAGLLVLAEQGAGPL